MRSPSPRRPVSHQGPEEIFYRDGRREVTPTETFGGPRLDFQQRPGTSAGSRPSRPIFLDVRYRQPPSDEEEEEQQERRDEESGRRPPEMGEWEREQEGEREKGKGKSRRRVVRREDVEGEEEEEEEEEEKVISNVEEEESFEEESGMTPGMVSKIRDQLLGTGLSGSVISQGVFYKLLGER